MQPETEVDRDRPAGEARVARDRAPLLIVLVIVSGLIGFGSYLYNLAPAEAPDVGEGARILPVSLEIPEFHLVDHEGRAFDRSRLEGRFSLLFFGYTYCPDVCPVTLQNLAPVQDAMAEMSPPLQVVFVSVDPERDSGPRLAEYVTFFHPQLVGATGEAEEIERLAGAVGAFHQKAEQEDTLSYLVDHSASLFLIAPDARLHAVLRDPHDTDYYVGLLGRVISATRERL